jgi:hypothetical protein
MINIEKQEYVKQNVSFQSRWISEKEAAKIMSVSVSTLRAHRFLRKGLPYIKVGRAVRYSLEDIANFMQAHRIEFS